LRSGKRASIDRLVPLVSEQLRAIAHRQLAERGLCGTLQTTALLREAYIKLVDQSQPEALLQLNQALNRLAQLQPRLAR